MMLLTVKAKLSKFFCQKPYRQEITAVILLKLAALWLIWSVCFSHVANETVTAHAMLNRMVIEKHS